MAVKTHITKPELIRSLKFSIADGSAYYVMVGFGETFFTPFAIWLGTNSIELGLLNTLPLFLGALLQMLCPYFIRRFGSRQKFVIACVILQALTFLPMMFVPFAPRPFFVFLALVALYQILILVHIPAWNSWIADLIHESTRGDYFGFQKRVTQFVVFLSILSAGPLLKMIRHDSGSEHFAYVALFAIAMIARLLSAYFLQQSVELQIDFDQFEEVSLKEELRTLKDNHLGRLILLLALMGFSTYVSVPFFTPYMLKELKLDYDKFALVTSLVVMVRIFFSPAWGALCDKYGCRQMLVISSIGIAFMPVLWLVSDELWWLCVLQMLSGLFWSGYELSWFNFMMDSTTRHNRAQFFTMQQILSNLAMVFGSLIGGYMINAQGDSKLHYHEVFVLSGVLRLLLAMSIVFFIKEIRIVSELRYRDFAATFFKAVRDRGVFYVPEVLRREK